MEVDQEVAPVTSKKKVDKLDSSNESSCSKAETKKADKKPEAEDPKPRIVLTFRSDKAGAKSSTMKIVPTEEKHEEISPRRSTRLTAKWDSDDDNEALVSPNKTDNSHQPISENEDASDNYFKALKRSTRRRSKEFDNVIANAIARKEKSYNETTAPTRPSRRIKPTAKILANEELRIGLETQNNVRLGIQTETSPEEGGRTRRSVRLTRHNVQEEGTSQQSDRKVVKEKEVLPEEEEEGNQVMKLKHLCELGLKAINPEAAEDSKDGEEEVEEDEGETIEIDDDDGSDEEIDDDSEVISKLLEADSLGDTDDEFLCSTGRSQRKTRRSTRLNSWVDSEHSSPAPTEDDSAPRRRSSRRRRPYSSQAYDDVIESYKPQHKSKKARAPPPQEETQEEEQEEVTEPAGGSEGSEAAYPPEGTQIYGACFCEADANMYATPVELTEPVFCQAIELVDGVRVGCSHGAARDGDSYAPLVRAGPRTPYFLACSLHRLQLGKHMCCSTCGLFCTQGIFYQCSLGHLFHLECGVPYGDSKVPPGCPHCGLYCYKWRPVNKDVSRVQLKMHCSNKRIFLPDQREQCTPAYLGFSTLDPSKLAVGPMIPDDLLPLPAITFEKSDVEEDPLDAAEALCEAMLAREGHDLLASKIISCSNINVPLPSQHGASCVHVAARGGRLLALHLLHTAGADVNCQLANKTPLMLAVAALLDKNVSKSPKKAKTTSDKDVEEMEVDHKDEEDKDGDKAGVKGESERERSSDEDLMKVIKYLVAVGCDVNIPGPDGMTALHMAAQHGGTDVCAAILSSVEAAVDPRDQGGWTPLVWAAENCHADTVRFLLRSGAEARAADAEGNAAVHWCALAGSAPALQLLLDAEPTAANALNTHTDTPLHVAARQGHYACVVILLARGARTDVENSAGELAVDVCTGRCHAAISLNMQMTLAITDKVVRRRLLSGDISNGRELYPVPCVNDVDDTPLPDDFTYVTAHVMPSPILIDNSIASLQGCTCKDECTSTGCGCCVLGVRGWWAGGGRLAPAFPYHDPPMLFECNQTCGCNAKKCTNSVLTRLSSSGSIFIRASVFRCGGARGWGLRAEGRVARGAPVALYVGELLPAADADTRAADQYMFALDVKPDLLEQCTEKTLLCVDAMAYGGAARFINHSCSPNLAPVRVFTHTRDLRLPAVALFAAAHIAAGEELTFDYGDKFWSVKSKWMKCECGAIDCRYAGNNEETDT